MCLRSTFPTIIFFFSGYRIGKGEGFADMEYAMMVSMGAVNESTVVVTVVHDCQVKTFKSVLIKQRVQIQCDLSSLNKK